MEAEHVDELGHVNNLVWVRLVLDLATAHSNSVGLDTRAYRELGAWWIVHRQEIDYHAPAFPGEELVEVDGRARRPNAAGRTEVRDAAFGADARAGEGNGGLRFREPAGNSGNRIVLIHAVNLTSCFANAPTQ